MSDIIHLRSDTSSNPTAPGTGSSGRPTIIPPHQMPPPPSRNTNPLLSAAVTNLTLDDFTHNAVLMLPAALPVAAPVFAPPAPTKTAAVLPLQQPHQPGDLSGSSGAYTLGSSSFGSFHSSDTVPSSYHLTAQNHIPGVTPSPNDTDNFSEISLDQASETFPDTFNKSSAQSTPQPSTSGQFVIPGQSATLNALAALPNVASVFSSFSNIITGIAQETVSARPPQTQQEPAVSYPSTTAPAPSFSPYVQPAPASPVGPPPRLYSPHDAAALSDAAPKQPPLAGGPGNNYRLTAKRKIYAPLPGLNTTAVHGIEGLGTASNSSGHIAPPHPSAGPIESSQGLHYPSVPTVQSKPAFSLTSLISNVPLLDKFQQLAVGNPESTVSPPTAIADSTNSSSTYYSSGPSDIGLNAYQTNPPPQAVYNPGYNQSKPPSAPEPVPATQEFAISSSAVKENNNVSSNDCGPNPYQQSHSPQTFFNPAQFQGQASFAFPATQFAPHHASSVIPDNNGLFQSHPAPSIQGLPAQPPVPILFSNAPHSQPETVPPPSIGQHLPPGGGPSSYRLKGKPHYRAPNTYGTVAAQPLPEPVRLAPFAHAVASQPLSEPVRFDPFAPAVASQPLPEPVSFDPFAQAPLQQNVFESKAFEAHGTHPAPVTFPAVFSPFSNEPKPIQQQHSVGHYLPAPTVEATKKPVLFVPQSQDFEKTVLQSPVVSSFGVLTNSSTPVTSFPSADNQADTFTTSVSQPTLLNPVATFTTSDIHQSVPFNPFQVSTSLATSAGKPESIFGAPVQSELPTKSEAIEAQSVPKQPFVDETTTTISKPNTIITPPAQGLQQFDISTADDTPSEHFQLLSQPSNVGAQAFFQEAVEAPFQLFAASPFSSTPLLKDEHNLTDLRPTDISSITNQGQQFDVFPLPAPFSAQEPINLVNTSIVPCTRGPSESLLEISAVLQASNPEPEIIEPSTDPIPEQDPLDQIVETLKNTPANPLSQEIQRPQEPYILPDLLNRTQEEIVRPQSQSAQATSHNLSSFFDTTATPNWFNPTPASNSVVSPPPLTPPVLVPAPSQTDQFNLFGQSQSLNTPHNEPTAASSDFLNTTQIQNFFNNPPPLLETQQQLDLVKDCQNQEELLRHEPNQVSAATVDETGAQSEVSAETESVFSNFVEPPSSVQSEYSEYATQSQQPLLDVEETNDTNDKVTDEAVLQTIQPEDDPVIREYFQSLADRSNPDDTTSDDTMAAGNGNIAYRSVYKHWFFNNVSLSEETATAATVPKSTTANSNWVPFSMADSLRLQESLDGGLDICTTNGGRFDVNVGERRRMPVYWVAPADEVRCCSWFFKGSDSRLVPYEEELAERLESEYKKSSEQGEWNRKLMLDNGDTIVFHAPNVMVHFTKSQSPDSWTENSPVANRPRVIKRGIDEFNIEDGESEQVDHLMFMVHGIGSACDLKFRSVEQVVEDFRTTSQQLIQSHYRTSIDQGRVGRIEMLPISWHSELHSEESGIDEKLRLITLESIPKLRTFTNNTLLDILFYTSPVFCQQIIDAVANSINRKYKLYCERNPSFTGKVSLAGHSLGSVILFDILQNQQNPAKGSTDFTVGQAGTGQPSIRYPALAFQPKKFFAFGSPIGMFVTVRGINTLGLDYKLPTCEGFYNIFHPYDPVAYRIEALLSPDLSLLRPVLIPHHKGRKRMHLELRETIQRVGNDIKQRIMETFKSTMNRVYNLSPIAPTAKTVVGNDRNDLQSEVDQVLELQAAALEAVVHTSESRERTFSSSSNSSSNDADGTDANLGRLNEGKRVDYVLQEAPLEFFNEYLFALTSHVCYWESSDTTLFIAKEIYSSLGVRTDNQIPQQTLTIERPVTPPS